MKLINRLDNVIKKDKQVNPQYMIDVIKSDIFYLLNNYFQVEYNDIKVEINLTEQNKYIININTLADRIKAMQVLPQ